MDKKWKQREKRRFVKAICLCDIGQNDRIIIRWSSHFQSPLVSHVLFIFPVHWLSHSVLTRNKVVHHLYPGQYIEEWRREISREFLYKLFCNFSFFSLHDTHDYSLQQKRSLSLNCKVSRNFTLKFRPFLRRRRCQEMERGCFTECYSDFHGECVFCYSRVSSLSRSYWSENLVYLSFVLTAAFLRKHNLHPPSFLEKAVIVKPPLLSIKYSKKDLT